MAPVDSESCGMMQLPYVGKETRPACGLSSSELMCDVAEGLYSGCQAMGRISEEDGSLGAGLTGEKGGLVLVAVAEGEITFDRVGVERRGAGALIRERFGVDRGIWVKIG